MDQLFELRRRVCAKSAAPAVKTAILYAGGWFVIWLEGPPSAVDAALARSARDARHAHHKVIHRSGGRATLTDALTLATTQVPDRPSDFARRIYGLKALAESQEPIALWRRLAAPCALPHHPGLNHAAGRCVALVASQDNHSIDWLTRLASRLGKRIVYQRFATSQWRRRDVGAAYLDIGTGREWTRVQVLSRGALELSVVRQSLNNLKSVVILTGNRPQATVDLVTAVTTFVKTIATSPPIHLVSEGGSAESLQSGARRGAPGPHMVQMSEQGFIRHLALLHDEAICA